MRDSAPKCGLISTSESLVLTRSQRLGVPLKLASKWPISAATKRNGILRFPKPPTTTMALEYCAWEEALTIDSLAPSGPTCAADPPECAFNAMSAESGRH